MRDRFARAHLEACYGFSRDNLGSCEEWGRLVHYNAEFCEGLGRWDLVAWGGLVQYTWDVTWDMGRACTMNFGGKIRRANERPVGS